MSEPYLGEIRMFAGTFAPVGWVPCDGRSLPIALNPALFNLLGTAYGGDGASTFNVPNLGGRVPIHRGQGPALQNYPLGQAAGVESVTLGTANLAAHSHSFQASTAVVKKKEAKSQVLAQSAQVSLYAQRAPNVQLAATALTPDPGGGAMPHENRMPSLAVMFIIATEGDYPST